MLTTRLWSRLCCSSERKITARKYENRLSDCTESLILFVVVLNNIARSAVQNIANARQNVQIKFLYLIGIPLVNYLKACI